MKEKMHFNAVSTIGTVTCQSRTKAFSEEPGFVDRNKMGVHWFGIFIN